MSCLIEPPGLRAIGRQSGAEHFMTMTQSRRKKEIKFTLYHDVLEDTRLMEYVDYLRKTQQFPKVIRNALRLVWTLGEGDLSVLFELFPSLRGQFMPRPDELIEQFRQMLHQRMAAAMSAAPEIPQPVGPQQLELPLGLEPIEPAPPPVHHNETIEQTIQEAVQAGMQRVLNQLAAMQPLTSKTAAPEFSKAKPPSKNGNPKPLILPQIAMPTFDDEDDSVVIQHDINAKSDIIASFLDAAFGFQQRKDD